MDSIQKTVFQAQLQLMTDDIDTDANGYITEMKAIAIASKIVDEGGFDEFLSRIRSQPKGYAISLQSSFKDSDYKGKSLHSYFEKIFEMGLAWICECLKSDNLGDKILYLQNSAYFCGKFSGIRVGSNNTYLSGKKPRQKGGKVKAQNRHGDEKAKFLEAYAEFRVPPYRWCNHQWKSRANAVRDIRNMLNLTATDKTLDGWAKAFDEEANAQNKI